MVEVFVVLDTPIQVKRGPAYSAQVCGRETNDGRWEGWIEFDPGGVAPPIRTPRETTQPSRNALEYWATGLTATYLQGALERALRPMTPQTAPSGVAAKAHFDGPAPPPSSMDDPPFTSPLSSPLDPFEAYAYQGEDILMEELEALNEVHLRKIARAHQLATEEQIVRSPDRHSLAALIVAGVRSRLRSDFR